MTDFEERPREPGTQMTWGEVESGVSSGIYPISQSDSRLGTLSSSVSLSSCRRVLTDPDWMLVLTHPRLFRVYDTSASNVQTLTPSA